MRRRSLLTLVFCLAAGSAWTPGVAGAVETDQYLTWTVELSDSAEPLNMFLNDEIRAYLRMKNHRNKAQSHEELVEDVMRYFFARRRLSRIKVFARNSPEVELYPDQSLSNFKYRQMSIYRDPAFPYFVPMSRTLRIGDVYFGVDKLGHMFGFGNRYFKLYRRYTRKGLSEQEAMEKVIRLGMIMEDTVVGKLGDGVFSHGDMEANFQGFMLARDMCEGPAPYIERRDGKWVLAREIDLRDYVTPQFDESFNPCHYIGLRKRFVLRILEHKYCNELTRPIVKERFARYRQHKPSFSYRFIHNFYEAKNHHPQREQALMTRCTMQAAQLAAIYGQP